MVTKSPGLFVPDLRWVAHLSNQENIYYDHREDIEPRSAWLRLKKYVEENRLKVDGITLEFRSHIEKLPEKADGYFHIMGAASTLAMGGNGSWGSSTEEIWKFGVLTNGKEVKIQWWRVPELIVINEVVEPVEKCLATLIRNTNI